MSKLTADDEQTLLESVKQAVHYVDEKNMSPDDAIIKVARDMSLSPGFVRASVNAFNNGRQVSQWNANDSALDKLAEFQMADYDAVHREIWGKTEKEAHDTYTSLGDDVHSDYSKAPQWAKRDSLSKLATLDLGIEKKAEDEVPEHVRQHEATKQANSVWDAYARAKRSFEDARVKESAAKDVLTMRLALLTNYFKKFAYDRLPFDVVDKAAQSYYGDNGVALMDIMSDRFPKEKRAADTKRYWDKPLSKDAEPFTFIVNAIKAAADLSSASNALGMAKQAQEEAIEALNKEAKSLSHYLGHRPHPKGTRYAKPHDRDDPPGFNWGMFGSGGVRRLREGEEPNPNEDLWTGKNIGGYGLKSLRKAEKEEEKEEKEDKGEEKKANLPFVPTSTQPKSEKDTTFSISLIDGGDGEKEAGLAHALGHRPDPEGTRYAREKGKSKWHPSGGRRLEEGEEPKDDEEVFTGKNIGGWGLSSYNKPEEKDEEKEKQAVGGLLTGAIIGGGAKPAMEALIGGSAEESRVNKVLGQLSSPEHDDELRKIQAQVMLTEMMSDPDNPISEYNPEAVLQAYNDITQLAPRLAEQPAAMQPLLAKRLAGDVEPFEIKEIGEIERGLQQTSSVPDITKQSNDSILI